MTQSPDATAAAPQPDRTVLSKELAKFLIELSISLNKYTMYPSSHPALGPATQRVHARLLQLLEGRRVLSLGVAQRQLIIEGVATDPTNAVLKDLAGRLHDHNLGAVEFEKGVESHELHTLFQVLMTDPQHADGPFIQDLTKKLKPSNHITLFPVRYENLELIGDAGAEAEGDAGNRTRAAQLWVGLAQAAMGIEEDDDREGDELNDPAAVAEAISGHHESTAYDQVIVGYMLQIADELRGAETRDAEVLRKRMGALVDGLDESTLGRLLTMGGDRDQRKQFMKAAAEGMEVDAVIDLVTAATNAQGETVSRSLLRMLKKLAQQSVGGTKTRRLLAETSIRDQVQQLIEGWTLDDPTPGAYAEALAKMTSTTAFLPVDPEAVYLAEPDRVFQMALEINETGEPVIQAVDRLLKTGQAAWVLRGIRSAAAPTVVKAIVAHLSRPEKVMEFIDGESVNVEALELLLDQIGMAGLEPMLYVLKETEDRHKRRVMIDHIVSLGADVGPRVAAELGDERWQVQRNMLIILGRLAELPPEFNASDYVGHPEAKVRFEAVKILLADKERRDEALRHALSDPDERLSRLGLQVAIESCPPTAAPLIASKLRSSYPDELRVMAVRALGKCGGQLAVKVLLGIAAPRKRLFFWRTPRKSREYVASLTALQPYRDDVRVEHALKVAARSRDAEIARAGRGRG